MVPNIAAANNEEYSPPCAPLEEIKLLDQKLNELEYIATEWKQQETMMMKQPLNERKGSRVSMASTLWSSEAFSYQDPQIMTRSHESDISSLTDDSDDFWDELLSDDDNNNKNKQSTRNPADFRRPRSAGGAGVWSSCFFPKLEPISEKQVLESFITPCLEAGAMSDDKPAKTDRAATPTPTAAAVVLDPRGLAKKSRGLKGNGSEKQGGTFLSSVLETGCSPLTVPGMPEMTTTNYMPPTCCTPVNVVQEEATGGKVSNQKRMMANHQRKWMEAVITEVQSQLDPPAAPMEDDNNDDALLALKNEPYNGIPLQQDQQPAGTSTTRKGGESPLPNPDDTEKELERLVPARPGTPGLPQHYRRTQTSATTPLRPLTPLREIIASSSMDESFSRKQRRGPRPRDFVSFEFGPLARMRAEQITKCRQHEQKSVASAASTAASTAVDEEEDTSSMTEDELGDSNNSYKQTEADQRTVTSKKSRMAASQMTTSHMTTSQMTTSQMSEAEKEDAMLELDEIISHWSSSSAGTTALDEESRTFGSTMLDPLAVVSLYQEAINGLL